MLHWILAPDGLLVLASTLLLAGAACVLGPSRALGPFVLVALLLWAVATPFMAAGSVTLRGGLATAAWIACFVGTTGLVLGLLVARGARLATILAATVTLLAVQLPVAFAAQVLLQCYVGRYCPGL